MSLHQPPTTDHTFLSVCSTFVSSNYPKLKEYIINYLKSSDYTYSLEGDYNLKVLVDGTCCYISFFSWNDYILIEFTRSCGCGLLYNSIYKNIIAGIVEKFDIKNYSKCIPDEMDKRNVFDVLPIPLKQ